MRIYLNNSMKTRFESQVQIALSEQLKLLYTFLHKNNFTLFNLPL